MQPHNKPTVIFRADGDSSMGLGHLVRSSALAAMLSEDFTTVLATRCSVDSVLNEAKTVFSRLISLPAEKTEEEVEALVSHLNRPDLLVLDGYHFDEAYQNKLAANGIRFFAIDDIHAYPFGADVVINHAGGLSPLDYTAKPATQFYLGPHYSLLRRPFLEAAKNRRNHITDSNCFVCFGGADPNNRTLEIVKEQMASPGRFAQLHVVVGGAYQYRDELAAYAKNNGRVHVYSALSPEAMVAVMQQCSYAICSPSTIVYEYLSVGGIVFLDQIADNQKDVIRYFTGEGIAFPLAEIGAVTAEESKAAFQKQAALFDGKSGDRLRKLFCQYVAARRLHIRSVMPGDLEICFNWANDAFVRQQSYNQSAIQIEDHTRWFTARLQDPDSYFYLFELDGEPVAQIRFQRTGEEAVLGYLVAPAIRQRGLGTAILGKGIETFLADAGGHITVVGHVKKENIASQRSFEKLAFAKTESTAFPDSFTYTMKHGN